MIDEDYLSETVAELGRELAAIEQEIDRACNGLTDMVDGDLAYEQRLRKRLVMLTRQRDDAWEALQSVRAGDFLAGASIGGSK